MFILLVYHVLFIPVALAAIAHPDKTVSAVAGGGLQYHGHPVDNWPTPPTLIYNCGLMRSICKNVQDFLSDTDNINAGMGTLPVHFHYDASKTNTNTRRGRSCPSAFERAHNIRCGGAGSPSVYPGPVPARVAASGAWGAGNGPFFRNEIPNALNTGPSGMRYTCEEFPAASWAEGGANFINEPPSTYVTCAPMALSCGAPIGGQVPAGIRMSAWAWFQIQHPTYPSVRSEQNWQGASHAALASYIKGRSTWQEPVARFRFSTTSIAPPTQTAAMVILPAYPNNPANTKVINARATNIPGLDPELEGAPIKCIGQFCLDLERQGFHFVDVVLDEQDGQSNQGDQPTPPQPAPGPGVTPFAQVANREVGEEGGESGSHEQTTMPPATLVILRAW